MEKIVENINYQINSLNFDINSYQNLIYELKRYLLKENRTIIHLKNIVDKKKEKINNLNQELLELKNIELEFNINFLNTKFKKIKINEYPKLNNNSKKYYISD